MTQREFGFALVSGADLANGFADVSGAERGGGGCGAIDLSGDDFAFGFAEVSGPVRGGGGCGAIDLSGDDFAFGFAEVSGPVRGGGGCGAIDLSGPDFGVHELFSGGAEVSGADFAGGVDLSGAVFAGGLTLFNGALRESGFALVNGLLMRGMVFPSEKPNGVRRTYTGPSGRVQRWRSFKIRSRSQGSPVDLDDQLQRAERGDFDEPMPGTSASVPRRRRRSGGSQRAHQDSLNRRSSRSG